MNSMSLLPQRMRVMCPYCGYKPWVLINRFKYQNTPIMVVCDDDGGRSCSKYFAVKIGIDITLITQLLSGE